MADCENVSPSVADQQKLLEDRLNQALSVVNELDKRYTDVDGVGKFRNKVKAEIRFLHELKGKRDVDLRKFLDTSNVVHFTGLIEAARRYEPCFAFFKSFSTSNKKQGYKLEVDLVTDQGGQWVKVISRSARGLAMEYVGAGSSATRSVLEQARSYCEMAECFLHFFHPPRILFEFLNGVPDLLAEKIGEMGINVVGKRVPIQELVTLPEDSEPDDDESEAESAEDKEYVWAPGAYIEKSAELAGDYDTVNLDVSSVFVLISAMTNGGANYKFSSAILNGQAALERKKAALPPLLSAISGKKLIMCQSAFDSVQSILGTLAGPGEKQRAEKLLKNVRVVEDHLSEKAANLRTSDKISPRSKIIFGTGDFNRAVTVTANRHFLCAASHQGVRFAAILHESRALSEQKQLTKLTEQHTQASL